MTDPRLPDPQRPETPAGEPTQEIPRHDGTREIPVVHQPYAPPVDGGATSQATPGAAFGAGSPGPTTAPGAPAYGPMGTGTGTGTGPTPPRRRSSWWRTPVTALAAALLASGVTAAYFNGRPGPGVTSTARPSMTSTTLNTQAPLSQGDSTAPDWKATARAVSPSVVSISVQDRSGNGGEGSGVILDAAGHIVTNNHVVGDNGSSPQIIVTLDDQRAYEAKIVGLDPSTDLAVIKLQGDVTDLKPIAVGNSDQIAVGAPVMAVGNPLGLSGTVTTGIVSALNRPVRTDNPQQRQPDPLGGIFGQQQSGNEVITNAIQTSAPINPGNSGGALVNADGQLIGINSSIASMGASSGGQSGSIGIGFAIPVNEAVSIADQLIKTGTAQHAFLGVSSTTGMVKDGGNQRVAAVVSSVVPGSPADKAGLRAKDAVIAIDGEPVTGSTSLVAQVRERKVGDTATMTYLRDGKRADVEVTFAQRTSR